MPQQPQSPQPIRVNSFSVGVYLMGQGFEPLSCERDRHTTQRAMFWFPAEALPALRSYKRHMRYLESLEDTVMGTAEPGR